MEALSHVEVADHPIIAMDDVVAYDAVTHEMELTREAFDRLVELQVPVSGTSFVVCVDGEPVYWGAFWTLLSSLAFDGVTIWQPLGSEHPTSVRLELGYPSAEAYDGDDPRSAHEVLRVLQEAGKMGLVSEARTCPLPHGMKGYELYSWQEEDEWHFTLISGTNRAKATAEIVAPIYIVSEDGWVQLHVVGLDEIKDVLGRLPTGESIYWLSAVTAGSGDVVFELPPQTILHEVVRHAATCGVDLRVANR
jgi:hypothetical protein